MPTLRLIRRRHAAAAAVRLRHAAADAMLRCCHAATLRYALFATRYADMPLPLSLLLLLITRRCRCFRILACYAKR